MFQQHLSASSLLSPFASASNFSICACNNEETDNLLFCVSFAYK
jgi:hypothetical protein